MINIKFTTLHIHNFLSIGDATIDLSNRGYCLITGINHNVKDAALSNGSGKSSLFSAICWALTGETIQGLSKNLVNIFGTDGCFVDCTFYINKDKYRVIRYKDHSKFKTDLKIYVNDEEKSGKGIRESQEILSNYLPDITSQLIGSVIILGQGLPHKFTNYSPAGRKDILEKLSKSDFMIEDIKNRLSERSKFLNDKFHHQEIKIHEIKTIKELKEREINKLVKELEELNKPKTFDEDINRLRKEIESQSSTKKELSSKVDTLTKNKEKIFLRLNELEGSKYKATLGFKEEEKKQINPLNDTINQLSTSIKLKKKEITDIKNIKDVCPTCGQKLKGVEKPSTVEKEKELSLLEELLTSTTKKKEEISLQLKNQEDASTKSIVAEITSKSKELDVLNSSLVEKTKEFISLDESLNKNQLSLHDIIREKDTLAKNIEDHNKSLTDNKKELENLTKELEEKTKEFDNIQLHIDIINKIDTLVKRDFRGFLLVHIIDFLNNKIKEYSKIVFETDEIGLISEGTNLNLNYCGKAFENLSGGEQQRVNIIVQFAIRDMMCKYLGFSSNILCIDEVLDTLDLKSANKVLNLISSKATDVESLFIISHQKDELQIPYDTEVIIEKNEKGISSLK